MSVLNQQFLDLVLINCGFAFSQYIVLRAGVFSIATAGFACLGAYTAAILVTRYDFGLWGGISAAMLVGLLAGMALSIPLARLRGVYQAIATLAFVQIVNSVMLFAEDFTRGAMGINSIPQMVTTGHLAAILAIIVYFLWILDRSGTGRAFNAVRQDETVASALGVSVAYYHALAFALSGAIGGLFGGLQALYVYSVEPSMFAFPLLVAVLTFVVFGGRNSVWGPIAGASLLTLLPEISRPLADLRMFVYGALLIAIIVFLPHGVADSAIMPYRRWRSARRLTAQPMELSK